MASETNMPPTRQTSEYIRSVYAQVAGGSLSLIGAIAELDGAKAREELRLTMTRQRFGTDPSERGSIRNKERWHQANIHALEAAKEELARAAAAQPELP